MRGSRFRSKIGHYFFRVKNSIRHGIRHKMDPRLPKTFQEQALQGPSGFQDIPGRPQNAPKTIPRPPRRFQDVPKIPQDGPKSHQGLPKTPCGHPKKLLRSTNAVHHAKRAVLLDGAPVWAWVVGPIEAAVVSAARLGWGFQDGLPHILRSLGFWLLAAGVPATLRI